ncbi:deoxynucleoside kinase [bacterium]|nr:deoxynucleoside kinase [bacterium]
MTKLKYLAVEGVIGAGKTSLADIIAEEIKGMLILEKPEDNPFLQDFYNDRKRFAFQTQLYFLLSRFRQLEMFPQPDLFHKTIVSDYIFAKDRIFASINLDEREMRLYDKIVAILEPIVPLPDLVIYLQSTPERVMHNIRIRDRKYERELKLDYLMELNEAYNRYFWDYNASPLLVINADHIDFVNNKQRRRELLNEIKKPVQGTRYYNPSVSLL